jgi:long-chain acyl-CoA synthetase
MTVETEVRTAGDITRYHARTRPDKPVLFFEGRETTFRDLDRHASMVANGLISEDVPEQGRIAYLDKNSDLYFELSSGAGKANDVIVPVNWRLAPPEMAYVINDAQSHILFVGEEFFPALEQIAGQLTTVRKIIALNATHPEWEDFASWRDRQSDEDPRVPATKDDVAVQMYTSGTTGHPKGVQLTNENIFTLLPSALHEWSTLTDDDVNLVCMPLYHIAGSGWGSLGIYAGCRNVVLRDINPSEILRLIPDQHITKALLVPAVLLFLTLTPGVREGDYSSLKYIAYSASPAPLDLLRTCLEIFKCDFAQLYGLTETTGAITYLPPEDHTPEGNQRMRSCGKPLTIAEIRVVDSQGKELPVGEVGEIICRSKQNMKGYWNLPEETEKAMRDGWFYTGDAGYFDSDGYLYIHDRVKDMIVSGGENVYPAEVESAIHGHPAVADVGVIGVPDDQWGEAVKAVIVLKPGAEATAEDIISFARQRIGGYKVPKSIDFVETLPRNPTGKILKRELRAPYWEGRSRQVN